MQRRFALLAALAVLTVACAAVRQQRAEPPATDDLHFQNLQVLPQNISRDDLLTAMRRFNQALGVRCDHCHVPNPPGSEPQFDFPSDAKPAKQTARVMIVMTRTINRDYVARVPDAYTTVSCWTCHRGEVQPHVVPSLPEPPPGS